MLPSWEVTGSSEALPGQEARVRAPTDADLVRRAAGPQALWFGVQRGVVDTLNFTVKSTS